ncbi:MAG: hypothetical protein A3K19_31990 [Lentisphaerae bacterium RIFOXYB12_FULL_65_16]|nr:MAG: hypothetical protein A3K18_10770 [Lentisphaerae bacterium RIFOXYA12_64_32]OGV88723.1 MAG: hypothetical protein A3K19_31990 [Lentisphaerae bacterium RIFOXYB12_FULL_65_16]
MAVAYLHRLLLVVLMLALLASVPAFARTRPGGTAAATDGWTSLCYLRKPEGNLSTAVRWNPDTGVRLRIEKRETGESVVFDISGTRFAATLSQGDEATRSAAALRVHLGSWFQRPTRSAALLIKFRESEWAVYVENQLVGRIAAPFLPPATVYYHPAGAEPLVTDETKFQPVTQENFQSDFMVEEGAPNPLYPWRVETGDWAIHTALDDAMARPETDKNRVKQVPLTADKSPNFYSLKGHGTPGIIVTGYDFFDEYEYSAAVQVNNGEGGLIFYHRDARNYYGFTLRVQPPPTEGGMLVLWRVRDGVRTVLARIATDLFIDQWYRPMVRVEPDRIRCLLDGVEVAVVEEDLPPSGSIGLYSDSATPVRFDDVILRGLRRLPLETVAAIHFQTLAMAGTFVRPERPWHRGTPPEQTELRPYVLGRAQWLMLGRTHHQNTAFRAEFTPRRPTFEIGLYTGYRGPTQPALRFTVRRTNNSEIYSLIRVDPDAESILEAWQTPRPPAAGPVTLTVDGSTPGELRFYRDHRLVLVHHSDAFETGAAGLYVGPDTATTVRNLDYDFDRPDRHLEQLQPVEAFRKDSFMRHWSAPEGQWVAGDGGLWHVGDFLGDFGLQLPYLEGGEVHAGIEDGKTEGPLRLTLKEGRLSLRYQEPGAEHATETVAALPVPATGGLAALSYTLHCAGYWTWVTVDGGVILRQRMTEPLIGTRLRTGNYTLENMANSRATREHVIDDSFNTAPSSWIINGGTWQVVNRFQCTPSWSHMIGEAPQSMGALWSKYVFEGDLTLEFYAGMRQGYYTRAGDINSTMMASTTAPDSGYTVTCTEWDYNHSQNGSTLYRRGARIDHSDKYLVPRHRKGNVRKLQSPLIAEGRPIHGAWYYIKFRRVGHKIEYWFDYEKVFSWEDSDPIPAGLVGVWTFMNSMTLAQVKITFDHLRPRPFAFHLLPPEPEAEPALPPTPAAGTAAPAPTVAPLGPPAANLRVQAMPLDALDGAWWSVSDDVGHARLTPFRMNTAGVRITDQLGSGSMYLASRLPSLPLESVAGWRVYMKRSPRARLNFHYSIGVADSAGNYSAQQQFFHQINGSDFSQGEYELTGRTPLRACRDADKLGGDWDLVQVWIPSRVRALFDRNAHVRIEGLGNLQPDNIACGIGGAFPGDTFAVRELVPVFYDAPPLALKDPTAPAVHLAVRRRLGGPLLYRAEDPGAVNTFLRNCGRRGLNTAWLRVTDPDGRAAVHELAWIRLPEKVATEFKWHPTLADTVQLRALADYPDRRFAAAAILLDGKALPLTATNDEIRQAAIPRTPEYLASVAPELTFSADPGSGAEPGRLRWRDRKPNLPPVLLRVEGLTPFCETFEPDTPGERVRMTQDGRMTAQSYDATQGRYLLTRNREYEQRLATDYTARFSIAAYPLMQFRYRAFDMTYITAMFTNGHYVRLSDDYGPAVAVRFGNDLKFDEAWHSWLGFASDAFTTEPFATSRFDPDGLRLASWGSPDQTGRYSHWNLDDLVFGPAVRAAEQLQFTPQYWDADGVATVVVAVSAGPACFADLADAARQALAWTRCEPAKPLTPAMTSLADGVHHLLMKAVDTRGVESAVTDVPFLLDTKPLLCSHGVEPMADPASNGVQLRVTFANDGGAPWQIGKANFFTCGQACSPLPAWTSLFRHAQDSDTLILNYPFILRDFLDKAKNGDTLELAIDNITDGAGNPSPRVACPLKVDYASDKTGPAWYATSFGASVNWFWNWDGCCNQTAAFAPGSNNAISVIANAGQSPFLQTLTYYANGEIWRNVEWRPAQHPWASFRLCMPGYKPDSALTLHLMLKCADGKVYSLSLIHPAQDVTELNRSVEIKWQPDEWKRLSFNVPALLAAAGVDQNTINGTVVQAVGFRRTNATHQQALWVDDFFLHTTTVPGNAPDTLKWQPYDASGVAALDIACYNEADQVPWKESRTERELDLRPLRARADGKSWLMCQAKDKAGNLSIPFWMPFPK